MTRLNEVMLFLMRALLCGLLGLGGYIAMVYGLPIAQNARTASGAIPADIHSLTLQVSKDSATIATDIHRDVVVAGGAEAETEKTMRLVRSAAPGFIQQGHQILSGAVSLESQADQTLRAGTITVNAATKLINDAATVPPHANAALDGVSNVSQSVNLFVTDPAMKGTLDNVNLLTGNMATATADFAKKEHELFWPAPCTKFCGLKRAYQISKGVVELAEPAYYMKGLF